MTEKYIFGHFHLAFVVVTIHTGHVYKILFELVWSSLFGQVNKPHK